jgi:hypothetical protein
MRYVEAWWWMRRNTNDLLLCCKSVGRVLKRVLVLQRVLQLQVVIMMKGNNEEGVRRKEEEY